MGKATVGFFVLLLIAFSVVVALPVHAAGLTIVVPDDYPTIQEAVNHAYDGDTVIVKAGNYNGTVTITDAITLIGQRGATITDWVIDGKAAILIEHSNVTVKGMKIDNPDSGGWSVKRGIHLLGVSNCVIENNVVVNTENGEGIWLYQSQNNIVSGNTVENCYPGISVGQSTDNIITNNSVRSNWEAISVYYSADNNTFSGNEIFSDHDGITLRESSGNRFFDNRISRCQVGVSIGIYAYEGEYINQMDRNLFFCNNFIGNTKNIASSALNGTTYFDNGKVGNYYSDYTGTDANGDGIGDTPYPIVTQGLDLMDHYPLMREWTGDNLPPVITVLSPQNVTYTQGEVSLNLSVSKPTSQIAYTLDGSEPVIITANTTITELTNGNHTVVIYATDLAGNEAAPKTVSFTVNVPQPQSTIALPIAGAVVLIAAVAVIAFLVYRKKQK